MGNSQRVKEADYSLVSLHNIKEAMPELWKEGEQTGDVRYAEKIAIETPVIA